MEYLLYLEFQISRSYHSSFSAHTRFQVHTAFRHMASSSVTMLRAVCCSAAALLLSSGDAIDRALDRLGDETERLVKAFNDKLDGK